MSTLNLGKGLEVLYTFDDADGGCRRNQDKNMRRDYDLPAEWEAMTDEQRRVQRRYAVIHD